MDYLNHQTDVREEAGDEAVIASDDGEVGGVRHVDEPPPPHTHTSMAGTEDVCISSRIFAKNPSTLCEECVKNLPRPQSSHVYSFCHKFLSLTNSRPLRVKAAI